MTSRMIAAALVLLAAAGVLALGAAPSAAWREAGDPITYSARAAMHAGAGVETVWTGDGRNW